MNEKKAKLLRNVIRYGFPEESARPTSYVETTKGGFYIVGKEIAQKSNTLKLSDNCGRGLYQRLKRAI